MVILRWNKYLEQWFMCDHKGKEMYRFFNCVNINRLFLNLNKKKLNYYPLEPMLPVEKGGRKDART